ncbi:hypothetical protein ACET81_21665 [Aeromonas veronii]
MGTRPLPDAGSVPGGAADGAAPRARPDRLQRLPRARQSLITPMSSGVSFTLAGALLPDAILQGPK